MGFTSYLGPDFFMMEINPEMGLFEYRVTFEPEIDSISIRRKLFQQKIGFGTTKAFDGARLCLPEKLPFEDDQDLIFMAKKPFGNIAWDVKVRVQFVKKASLFDAIQFYNVLLRRALDLVTLKYFKPMVEQGEQRKLEIWRGYDASLTNSVTSLMVCLDTSHKVLRNISLLDFLDQLKAPNKKNYKAMFHEAVVGKTVLIRFNNTFHRIDEIDWSSSPTFTFAKENKQPASFKDYYLQQHSQLIQRMDQPLLISEIQPRKNDISGKSQEIILIPELAYLTGLSEEITPDFKLMKDRIQRYKITPLRRADNTIKFVRRFHRCDEAKNLLKSWGLSIVAQ